jgi:hypothetical protein
MTTMRRLILALVLAALAGGQAGPALAADSATVDATVSVEAACLTISSTEVDFGTLSFSSDGANPSQGVEAISYTNCGGAIERIFGRGTDAAEVGGSTTWTLGTTTGLCPERGLNTFRAGAGSTTSSNVGGLLSTVDAQLETVAGGAAGQVNVLYVSMPCTGSDGSGATMSFQAIFTATF